MKKHLIIATALAFSLTGIVKAQFTVTDSIGGVPIANGANLINFDGTLPSFVTLSGPANIVTGGRGNPDPYTAPYYSGSTAAYFGESPVNGFDATPYLAVESGGSATFTFSTPQSYFGLLWGSIDPGDNLLSFYNSSDTLIGTVDSTALSGVTLSDNADANGTCYANIVSSTPFSSVVVTTGGIIGNDSFELDDVAYATVVPEPSSNVLLAAGACVLGIFLRKKKA